MENKIILHRGYKGKYPENSKISFYYALKENLPFETDIRVSSDGVVYLIHDDNLDRLFNGSGKIGELSSGELDKFRYKEDAAQGLCPLDKLCELTKELKYNNLIFIHIKELKDIGKVIDILKKYDIKENIRFFAVDEIEEDFRKIMREKYPGYKIGLYLPENSKNYDKELFRESDFIWADEITFPWITKEKADMAHAHGKPFYAISPELIPASVFNSDIEKRWQELLEAGADGICTDKPERFEEFFRKNEIQDNKILFSQ